MNEICTSFEQSKRLIELGLDVETSDMHYIEDSSDNPYCELYASKLNEEARKHYNTHYIPAWSLAVLMKYIWKNGGTATNVPKLYEDRPANGWYILTEELYETSICNSILDAAFEMVCWLLENKKI